MKEKRLLEHYEFAKIRRQIESKRREGIKPTEEQIKRLRELDNWLATNTSYWRRHYGRNTLQDSQKKT